MAQRTLLFVYNADSGGFHALADLLHKTFRPSTYKCNLCKVTYSPFGMKAAWREFLDGLDMEIEFLHRDEFHERYPECRAALPVVLRLEGDGDLDVLLPASEMNACESLAELQAAVREALTSA